MTTHALARRSHYSCGVICALSVSKRPIEVNVSNWMSDVMGETVPHDLDELYDYLQVCRWCVVTNPGARAVSVCSMQDGRKLIKLVNTIRPGCCKHKPNRSRHAEQQSVGTSVAELCCNAG